MFEYAVETLAALPPADLAAAVSDNHHTLVQAETRQLQLAAAWADAHTINPGWPNGPLIERASVWGGDGTPAVGEFCCLELGALLGVGMMAGRSLIADALDVRHRLPRLWERVCDGQVRAWKARRIAQATRHLSWDAAADVDEAIHGLIETPPGPASPKILHAAITDADPELAAERETNARTRRGVWTTSPEDGIKTLIARANAGDIIVLMATINRIADILKLDDERTGRPADTIDIRRARAIALLAQPAQALALLLNHRNDEPAPGDTEPDEPEPDESEPDDTEPDDTEPDLRESEPAAKEPAAEQPDRGGRGLWLPELPAWLDRSKLTPKVVLHFHLSDQALWADHGLLRPDHTTNPGTDADPLSLQAFKTWLADTGCQIQIRPILDPDTIPAVDRYEIPTRMRAALHLRELADAFPYGTLSTRQDLDHTTPYDDHGPPGQTHLGNLGPLSRTPHRAATVAPPRNRWRKRQPDPGTYIWRSPAGWIWLVTNQGTLNLGNTPYSRAIWRAAKAMTA